MLNLHHQLATLPLTPGIYMFKDSGSHILYIGKAINLRHRVKSYFRILPPDKGGVKGGSKSDLNPSPSPLNRGEILQPSPDLDPSKREMVPRINQIATISTDTETEALILEANLVRQHQPPYNVLLRDDKFFLFIKITTPEEYPRVFPVRRLKPDGARYFGPYSSASSVRQTLKLLRRLFPHRTDHDTPRDIVFPHSLFSDHAAASQTADKKLSQTEYRQEIDQVIRFLRGDRDSIITTLRHGMKQASSARQFERAAIYRDQLRAIERLEGFQKVYLPRPESFDLISLARQPHLSAANIFSIRRGKLLNKNTFLLRHRPTTPEADVLRQFFLQYYRVAQDIPQLILLPLPLSDAPALTNWINPDLPPKLAIPRRGLKRQLMLMGQTNAEQLLKSEETAWQQEATLQAALTELARALNLPANTVLNKLPRPYGRGISLLRQLELASRILLTL